MFALYISFDAEFNADSEYVHDYEVNSISRVFFGQKPCILDISRVLMDFWAN